MQRTQTENFFTNFEELVHKAFWLCFSLMKSNAYRYGLVTPDIRRDWARIKELAKANDNEQAEWAMLRTLRRLGSRLEEVQA